MLLLGIGLGIGAYALGMPREQKRRLPWIEKVQSGGRTKWRAVVRLGKLRRRGSLRDTQELAHRDAIAIRDDMRADARPRAVDLRRALADLVQDARDRGVRERSVRGSYQQPGQAILTGYWDGDMPLDQLTEEELRWFVREALDRGLAPATIKRNYLRVLHAAIELAGLPSPVPRVRRSMRGALAPQRYEGPYMDPETCGALLYAMESWVYPGCRALRHRQRDIDLVLLLMTTGLRAAEFERCLASDWDADRLLVSVREPKVRSLPRVLPVADVARNALLRLLGGLSLDQPLATEDRIGKTCQRWAKRLPEFPNLRGGRSLRRSYAFGLRVTGCPREAIRDLMGHARNMTITDRYIASTEEERRSHVNLLAAAIQQGWEKACGSSKA